MHVVVDTVPAFGQHYTQALQCGRQTKINWTTTAHSTVHTRADILCYCVVMG